jgi:Fur family ferric uptake transcriptional regulator
MHEPTATLAILDAAGLRRTEPRRTVAELIAAREGHFTAADLADDARRRRLGIGRATIFRALDILLALHAVERIDLPNGEHAYVTCRPDRHHHHLVCSGCGRTADVGDGDLATVTEAVERATGFVIDTHRLELYGRCPDCRTRA